MEKQKWINEGGVYYPIPGYASLYTTPGSGVYQINEDTFHHRLGLSRIAETFEFGFKLYDLGCDDIFERVTTTWLSDTFSEGQKNLGVIFNGLKGTGKTIAAKLLSNRLGLPVIVISKPLDGLLEFIQSLCFECIILIDEAEKTFSVDKEVLLKMIDGVYNESRKLYLLTTNRLTLDENLLGRPGRIRYIKQFGNLTPEALNAYLDDNLADQTKRQSILELVDTLVISTIDILKAIVDETNIYGEVPDGKMLNIPKADYHFDVVHFCHLDSVNIDDLKKYITDRLGKKETVADWLRKKVRVKEGNSTKTKTNLDIINDKFDCWISWETIPSASAVLLVDQAVRGGVIVDEPDKTGFFKVNNTYNDEDELYCIVSDHGIPSLYRGRLF